ncbi:MAG TPA: methylmalonyl-CoA mutase family protein, partial [Acidimicrobiales bacterium]|nr:methylmalonyl-CoA mutase family protein [Acidimicrobiales bacterium]
MIVVDASALVDVLLDRPVRSAVVDHFATGLCAPAHQPAEALSAISRVVRAGLISAEDGRSALLELTLLDQEHVAPSAEHLRRAIELQDRVRVLDGLYVALAEQRGVDRKLLQGTTQNDLIKEYLARGTYIYPPEPSMRITTDMFAYCARELPRWNTISISGYHIREAGSTAVQELAFTLSNAIAYVEAAVEAGLDVEEFAPRLSFFFNAHNDLFQEVAKYRAARRMWARIVRERFGGGERSQKLRFHTQTAG